MQGSLFSCEIEENEKLGKEITFIDEQISRGLKHAFRTKNSRCENLHENGKEAGREYYGCCLICKWKGSIYIFLLKPGILLR